MTYYEGGQAGYNSGNIVSAKNDANATVQATNKYNAAADPYHVSSQAPTVVNRVNQTPAQQQAMAAAQQATTMTGVPTNWISQYAAKAAPAAISLKGTPTGQLGQVAASKVTPLQFNAYGGSHVGDYNFTGGGAINGNTGQADVNAGQVAQGDWGIDPGKLQIVQGVGQVGSAADVMQGAKAAANVIHDWGTTNADAAGASAIDRGMGRSGVYDAARIAENYKADLAVQQAYGDAAAKQGELDNSVALQNGQMAYNVANANQGAEQAAMLQRAGLNQGVALQNGSQIADLTKYNAGTQADIAKANQSAGLQADSIRSGYNMNQQQLDQKSWVDQSAQRLGYSNSDRQQQQFNDSLAQTQTQANRDYQMNQLQYSNGQYEFGQNNALARTAADRGYQQQGLNYNEGIRQYDTSQNLAQWVAQQSVLNNQNQLAQNASQYGQTAGYNAGQDAIRNNQSQQQINMQGQPSGNNASARVSAASAFAGNAYLQGKFPDLQSYFAALGI